MTHDPKHTPEQQDAVQETPVNASRRKLTQASLAAPVVLGTLASRKVLAQDAWNCTISGQISGNISRPGKVNCASLGKSPNYYADLQPSTWPGGTIFYNSNTGNPRKFSNTPFNASIKFKDAFERHDTNNPNNQNIGSPTVLDVLQGDWKPNNSNRTLRVRITGEFDTSRGIELGQEAVAAYMNAVDGTNGYPSFPISPATVVNMFNAVIVSGGRYTDDGVNWGIADVIAYFKSLHS